MNIAAMRKPALCELAVSQGLYPHKSAARKIPIEDLREECRRSWEVDEQWLYRDTRGPLREVRARQARAKSNSRCKRKGRVSARRARGRRI